MVTVTLFRTLDMNQVDEIFSESEGHAERFAVGYLDYLSTMLKQIDTKQIVTVITALMDARKQGKTVFFIGNGGSAATASHFANDLAIGTRSWDKPFRIVSLTDNLAVITAIGNDDGYDLIFERQLRVLMQPGDLVVAISASGNSPNIITALNYAKANGAVTIGLSAFDGGQLAKMVDMNIHIPTNKGEYGPAEDGHMILDHLIGSFLTRAVQASA